MVVGGCENVPTPNPAIEATVEPVGTVPVSGVVSIAAIARGASASTSRVDRFEWDGELFGSLATVRPVAVVVLDLHGRPMGCAAFASDP